MIVISAGMEKAGTGWYYNMTNDLMVLGGHQDARLIRDKYRLKSVMRYDNCNIEYPVLPTMLALMIPHLRGESFVVKTHQAPTPILKWMLKQGIVKATYLYRDPRDVVVSVYEHGISLRYNHIRHPFSKLDTIEKAIHASNKWIRVWEKWTSDILSAYTYIVRYEDLLRTTYEVMSRLTDYLQLNITPQQLETVIEKYKPHRLDAAIVETRLHFNKGQVGNYRDALDDVQRRQVEENFSPILTKMGYSG